MPEGVTFIHLTDLHVGSPDQPDPHLHTDTTATLREVLAKVQAIEPRPSFVIASGDLTNRGDTASFRTLKALFADVGLPVLYALGNHDTRPGFYGGMLDRSEDLDAPYFYDEVIDGIHVIVLDSSTPGRIGGTIEPEQFAWLEAVLDVQADLPKLIVSHHPPALGSEPEAAHWRTIEFGESQRLAGMLRGRNILGILSGHIHHDRVSLWHGVPVIVGTGQHAATDILYPAGLRMVRGASFGLGTIRKSGMTMAFIPLPSDRAELALISYDRLKTLDRMPNPVAAE